MSPSEPCVQPTNDLDPGPSLDRCAAVLADLCDDFGELETLAMILSTFPASYGASPRLAERMSKVASKLWVLHDDAVK